MMRLFVFVWLSFFGVSAFSETPKGLKEKAVLEGSPERGIKLSEKAISRLGLNFFDIQSTGKIEVPNQGIVHSLSVEGVYRVRDGWFKFLIINPLRKDASTTTFQSSELAIGDRVVTLGSELVRVAEMEEFSGEEP